MICAQLSTLLGFDCCPLNEAGNVALIETPFQFADGDGIPVYTEVAEGLIRFFDDGGVMMHFMGRGLPMKTKRHTKFIQNATVANGTVLTESGEVEVWAKMSDAPSAFAKYIATMLHLASWESSQQDINQDTSHFVEEVVLALRSWKPHSKIDADPAPIEGISGQFHKLDLILDGVGVIATGTHHAAVNATLHKLVDLNMKLDNNQSSFLVVIDDRTDPDAADREARVLSAAAGVLSFTQLEKNAQGTSLTTH